MLLTDGKARTPFHVLAIARRPEIQQDGQWLLEVLPNPNLFVFLEPTSTCRLHPTTHPRPRQSFRCVGSVHTPKHRMAHFFVLTVHGVNSMHRLYPALLPSRGLGTA